MTQLIANVCTKGSYERLDQLLDGGAVSPAVKGHIMQILTEAPRAEKNLAQAFAGEQIYTRNALAQMEGNPAAEDWASAGVQLSRLVLYRVVGPLLVNPHRTEREQAEFLSAISRLAQSRPDGTRPFARDWERRNKGIAVKNAVGHHLVIAGAPAFDKVIAVFWATDDLRFYLLGKLATQP